MLYDGLDELEQNGKPITVGIVGAGTFGTQIISQICQMTGMRMSVVADLQTERAVRALGLGGKTEDTIVSAQTSAEIDKAMHQGHAAVTTNAAALIGSGIDVVVEATGNPELGAKHGHMAILKKNIW